MKMLEHMPGPHEVGGYQSNIRVSGPRIIGPCNITTAVVVAGGGRADATARLYAAAPDLLAACEELLAVVAIQNGNLHADTNEIQAKARAAIAKAKGTP
jgi:hypothetical protein